MPATTLDAELQDLTLRREIALQHLAFLEVQLPVVDALRSRAWTYAAELRLERQIGRLRENLEVWSTNLRRIEAELEDLGIDRELLDA